MATGHPIMRSKCSMKVMCNQNSTLEEWRSKSEVYSVIEFI